MNYLEQLVAEWYQYLGYFVRTNVRASKLPDGGFKNEIDLLAYKPKAKELVHVETSGGTESWSEINQKVAKKFDIQMVTYLELVDAEIDKLSRVLVIGWSRTINSEKVVDQTIKILSIPGFLNRIVREVHKKDFMRDSIPEGLPLLRTIQMMDRFYDSKMINKRMSDERDL